MMSRQLRLLSVLLLLITAMFFAVGCAQTPATDDHEEGDGHDDEHEDDHEHEEGEEGETIPNDGAVITIVSPEDGVTVSGGQVEVEIEIEDFELEDGHWHIYVDGDEFAQLQGSDLNHVVNGLEAGEHEIEVKLANAEHQTLEDGDSITITVEE